MNPVKDSVTATTVTSISKDNAAIGSVKPSAAAAEDPPVRPDSTQATAADRRAQEARAQQRAALNEALVQVNQQGGSYSPALQFEQDDDSGVVIIKVLNRDTGEVIRELPPEAVIKAVDEGGLPTLVAETV